MFNLFQNIHIDWLGKRKIFIAFSIFIMLAGLISTIGRQYTPGGADAFNLGVDFKGGTVVVAKFKMLLTCPHFQSLINFVRIDPREQRRISPT